MKQTSHPFISINGAVLGNAAAPDYEREVDGVLGTVGSNRVGAALLQTIKTALVIVPHTGSARNAYASGDHSDRAGNTGHRRYSCANATPLTDASGSPKRYSAGGGTSSTIKFTPSQWMTSGMAEHQHKSIGAGARRDEILFHEMAHSIRQMAGVMNCSDAPAGFDTKDEYWSVLTSNIYASAYNRPLRKNHHGFTQISLADATAYFAKYAVMTGWMCREMPVFTRAVSDIAWIAFNPFRDYYVAHP